MASSSVLCPPVYHSRSNGGHSVYKISSLEENMHTFTRYMLFQIPGWVIAALVLTGLREWTGLSFWGASGFSFCGL
jgi:hypothetical protein